MVLTALLKNLKDDTYFLFKSTVLKGCQLGDEIFELQPWSVLAKADKADPVEEDKLLDVKLVRFKVLLHSDCGIWLPL